MVKILFLRKRNCARQSPYPGITIKVISPILQIGEGSYFNGVDVYCWDARVCVSIGKYCSFADKTTILAGGEHDKNRVSTYPFIEKWKLKEYQHLINPHYKGDILVGNDVWVGHGALLLSGIKIGNGSIIAAGSVVTRDVPPYSIVGGVPARLIRHRFDFETVATLESINWWDWGADTIKSRINDFCDLNKFLMIYGNNKK
jgi:acetyltransferase-like isoleucine patch superfamily enzyme